MFGNKDHLRGALAAMISKLPVLLTAVLECSQILTFENTQVLRVRKIDQRVKVQHRNTTLRSAP
jgi:hypothetical protein